MVVVVESRPISAPRPSKSRRATRCAALARPPPEKGSRSWPRPRRAKRGCLRAPAGDLDWEAQGH
eukprot:3122206-Pyramimonas_sp.AAC.1